jgi:HEPN domain-containing protein
MTNQHMAESAIRLAGQVLREAKRLHAEGAHGLTVRRSQEVVELALKGVLRFLGLEVPRIHDVSGFLRRHRDRLPSALDKHLDKIAQVSRALREEREMSFYGDEEAGFGPEEIYTAEDADKAILDATFIYELCEAVIKKKE